MNWKEWISKKEGKKDWFSVVFPFLLGLGVIFLVFSNTHISKQEEADQTQESAEAAEIKATYEEQLTRRLEDALSHIKGAGRVRVMLTLADGGEAYVLQDSEYTRSETEDMNVSGQGRRMVEEQHQTETVRDAAQQPFILREEAPKVRGILIMAEGADSSVVQQELLQATQALLGISAQRVHIASYQ
ncbi:MAG: hypothetical protein HFE64_09775 [Lachnospiraceae bacterium]|jgi:stage III sporulation protein AG|nr:hypothetical protein [Lachnospiraceae bacterium]